MKYKLIEPIRQNYEFRHGGGNKFTDMYAAEWIIDAYPNCFTISPEQLKREVKTFNKCNGLMIGKLSEFLFFDKMKVFLHLKWIEESE
jgi:hypothetical protein